MFLFVPAIALAEPNAADRQMSQMTALYEQVCLKVFPDDKAVEALMTERNARPLSQDEVKITMGDDPARGWELAEDQGASVWLELPPFHACSVRWNAPQIADLHGYGSVAERYESSKGGFHPIEPFDADHGVIHVHAVGEQRILPDQSSESLFVFDQHISDPQRRAAGDTGYVLRFVHQFAAPGAQ
jgi:hypothetical protein